VSCGDPAAGGLASLARPVVLCLSGRVARRLRTVSWCRADPLPTTTDRYPWGDRRTPPRCRESDGVGFHPTAPRHALAQPSPSRRIVARPATDHGPSRPIASGRMARGPMRLAPFERRAVVRLWPPARPTPVVGTAGAVIGTQRRPGSRHLASRTWPLESGVRPMAVASAPGLRPRPFGPGPLALGSRDRLSAPASGRRGAGHSYAPLTLLAARRRGPVGGWGRCRSVDMWVVAPEGVRRWCRGASRGCGRGGLWRPRGRPVPRNPRWPRRR
jgi:hypothetical protein